MRDERERRAGEDEYEKESDETQTDEDVILMIWDFPNPLLYLGKYFQYTTTPYFNLDL